LALHAEIVRRLNYISFSDSAEILAIINKIWLADRKALSDESAPRETQMTETNCWN